MHFIKRKRTEEPEGWQLTLADMMTLLLCFFILIVAISSVDIDRYNKVSNVMEKAMGMQTGQKQFKTLKQIKKEVETVVAADPDAIELEERRNAVAINLRGAVFFESGSSTLTDKALLILNEIKAPLTNIPYNITVEGHTDNIPISSEKYPSNWELSSVRASSVARFLIKNGLPKNKIRVLGLADTHPLVPNTDPNGNPIESNQAKNRRVVILVSP